MTCLPPKFPFFFREGCWQAVRLCFRPGARTVINYQGEGDREAVCSTEDKGWAFIPEAGFQSLVRGRGDYADLPDLDTRARPRRNRQPCPGSRYPFENTWMCGKLAVVRSSGPLSLWKLRSLFSVNQWQFMVTSLQTYRLPPVHVVCHPVVTAIKEVCLSWNVMLLQGKLKPMTCS